MFKALKRFLAAAVIFVASFQLAFAETIWRVQRLPASSAVSASSLAKDIQNFGEEVTGIDVRQECLEWERKKWPFGKPGVTHSLDSKRSGHLKRWVDHLEQNSCSESKDYSTQWKKEYEKCPYLDKAKAGSIDKLARRITKIAKNEGEKEQTLKAVFEEYQAKLKDFYRRAEMLRGRLESALYGGGSAKERGELLVSYLENVLLPMRDMVIIQRSHAEKDRDHYFQNLLVSFPQNLLEEGGQGIKQKIRGGTEPQFNPLYLKIVDYSGGEKGVAFSTGDIINRDVMALMKAPTMENYFNAQRLMTIQMMMTQRATYKAIVDRDHSKRESTTSIPKSCKRHLAGDAPDEMSISVKKEAKASIVDSILRDHNLLFTEKQLPAMNEFYVDNNEKDMMNVGHRGLMPFEKYHHSKASLENKHDIYQASLDDVSYFEEILRMKLPAVKSVYLKNKSDFYPDWKIFEKILLQPSKKTQYELPTKKGTALKTAQSKNLSEFLIELMQEKKVSDVEDLISPSLRKELERRTVELDIPRLYGSAAWRNWGMRTLTNVISGELSEDEKKGLKRMCRLNALNGGSEIREICEADKASAIAKNLKSYLDSVNQNRPILPGRRVDTDSLKKSYSFLTGLWRYLRDYTDDFKASRPSEYEVLIGQMRAQNPWARLRLGYLIALEKLRAAKNSDRYEKESTRRGERMTSGGRCFRADVEGQLERMRQAGRRLGLDRPFHPGYADGILSEREKEKFWQQKLSDINSNNSNLFQTQISHRRNAYDYLEETSYQTLLSSDETENYIDNLRFNLFSQDRETLDEFNESSMAKRGEALKDIYDLRGNVEKQKQRFEDFLRKFESKGDLDVERNFISVDANMKAPIYRTVLRKAAIKRGLELDSQLKKLCALTKDEHDKMQTIFYMTTKSQNKINKMAGLPQVPEHVLSKVQEMSQEEWEDMWLGLGSAGLFMGAIAAYGACTGITAGTGAVACIPILVGAAGAAGGAIKLQAQLFDRVLDRKFESMENERFVKEMEKLGFAASGNSDNVSRTWLWSVAEAAFMIPLIGVMARAGNVSGRILYQGGSSLVKKQSARLFMERSNAAMREAEVKMAKNVLRFNGVTRNLKNVFRTSKGLSKKLAKKGISKKEAQKTLTQFKQLKNSFKNGEVSIGKYVKKMASLLKPYQNIFKATSNSVKEEFGEVSVRYSQEKIDRRTAKVVADYFRGDPHHFKRLLNKYGGKKLKKAQAKMQKIADKGKTPGMWAKLRYEHLAQNAHHLQRLKKEIATVSRHGNDLEDFIYRNMDDLTEVFLRVPMQAKELPYMAIWMGAPYMSMRRVPGLAQMGEGIIMRKFFNARARLVYESFRAQARHTLGLPIHASSETTAKAVQAFKASWEQSSEAVGPKASRKIAQKMAKWDKRVFDEMKKVIHEMPAKKLKLPDGHSLKEASDDAIKRLLFSPQGPKEKVLSERLWASLPQEVLVNSKSMEKSAHLLAKELSSYQNVNEFHRYLNALRVLSIKKDPGVVEFF